MVLTKSSDPAVASSNTTEAPSHPDGTAPQSSDVSQSSALLERCCWLICLAAIGIGSFLLWTFRVAFDHKSLTLSIGVMTFLVFIYVVYGKWRHAPVLSNLSGAIAVIYCSIGMGGIISLAGLRFRSPLIDEALASVDRSLGIDLPSVIVWFADHGVLSDVLYIAYLSSFFQLFSLVVYLAIIGRFDKLWQLAFVCSLTIVAATTISVFWPAEGAFAYFQYSLDVLDRLPTGAGTYHLTKFEYFRNSPFPQISFTNLQGVVTFPSFHCCLALMTIFATTGTGWLFKGTLILNAFVLVSILPIGGHYFIDLPCGALLWLAATTIAWRLGKASSMTALTRAAAPVVTTADQLSKEVIAGA